jgi:hypothetical protein
MSCENCNPIKMFREGCCTGETGRAEGLGVRNFVDKKNNVIYPMCGALEVSFDENTGREIYFCGDYHQRPEICRAYNCDRVLEERMGEDTE